MMPSPTVARACQFIRPDTVFLPHPMRATFLTIALENDATLDDVQRAAGHNEPSATKLYDHRGYKPGKWASFFATY